MILWSSISSKSQNSMTCHRSTQAIKPRWPPMPSTLVDNGMSTCIRLVVHVHVLEAGVEQVEIVLPAAGTRHQLAGSWRWGTGTRPCASARWLCCCRRTWADRRADSSSMLRRVKRSGGGPMWLRAGQDRRRLQRGPWGISRTFDHVVDEPTSPCCKL